MFHLAGRDPWQQCRGGAAQALTAAAVLVVPQLNGHSWADLFSRNYVFKAGFCAWLLAQTAKVKPRCSSWVDVASHYNCSMPN